MKSVPTNLYGALVGSLLSVGVLVAFATLYACGDDDSTTEFTPVDASTDRKIPPRDGRSEKDVDKSDTPQRGVEPGWARWSDYDERCNVRVPAEADAMPGPFEWEPCTGPADVTALGCQMLKARPEQTARFVVSADLDVRNRTPQLVLKYGVGSKYTETLVGPADGPMRFAIRSPFDCGVLGADIFGDRVGVQLFKERENFNLVGAYAIATVGERLRVAESWTELGGPSFYPSAVGLIRLLAGMRVVDWETLDSKVLVPVDSGDAYYQPGEPIDLGNGNVMVEAGNRRRLRQFVFAVDRATPIDLFSEVYREDHGIVAATDGTDIAWVERIFDEGDSHPRVDASYTAPFTLDPHTLATTKRPLPFRSDQAGQIGDNGKVGCGYWASTVAERYVEGGSPAYNGLQITRLSDGKQWFLSNRREEGWSWGRPLAVTCDDVFVNAYPANEGVSIARIPLSQLP